MKNQNSESELINRAPEGAKTNHSLEESNDWKTVVIDIIVKIITLGLYHVEKHRSGSGPENPQS